MAGGLKLLSSSGEFARLPFSQCDESMCRTALLPANKPKNRYWDVLPPDSTLVKKGVSYINANYITVCPLKQRRIIAAQAPLPHTCEDFWQMVLSHDTRCILMLTRLAEGAKIKSERYWPEVGQSRYFGQITVTTVRQFSPGEEIKDIIISELLVGGDTPKGRQEGKRVWHIHYLGWPDGKIVSVSMVVLLIALFMSFGLDDSVLMCSASIGRSGTIAAIIRGLLSCESAIEAVMAVRQDRHGCVQTVDQFRLVRDTLEYLKY